MASISVTIDCHDAEMLSEFWIRALGYQPRGAAAQFRSIRPGPESRFAGPALVFQQVAEPKTVKNRVHLDLDLDPEADLDAEVARIEALGASRLWETVELGGRWITLADPEGNEFCIVK